MPSCTDLTKEELYACMIMVAGPTNPVGTFKSAKEAVAYGNNIGAIKKMTKTDMIKGIKSNMNFVKGYHR